MKSTLQKALVAALILFAVTCVLGIAVPPTKASASVTSSQYGYYDSLLQGYYIFGEVKNDGDKPVTNITVNVNCYDASNNLLNTNPVKGYIDGPNAANTASPFVLNPGAKAPFKLQMQRGALSFSYQNINRLTSTASFTECNSVPVGLQASVSGIVQVLTPNVQGTIKNTGATIAENVFVYMIGYDSNGAILGPYGQKISASGGGNSLNPGETGDFSLAALIFPVSGETGIIAASYTITAQSFVTSSADHSGFAAQYAIASEVSGAITYSSNNPSPSGAPTPVESLAPSSSSASSSLPSLSPTSSQVATPTPVLNNSAHSENVWVPSPTNAVVATAASVAAVSVVAAVASAVSTPAEATAGGFADKVKDILPETIKGWLEEKRKPHLKEKEGSPFVPMKTELMAYIICILLLSLAYSFVKATDLGPLDFSELFLLLPTLLLVGFVVGFVKTFFAVTYTRSAGVWTEHKVWYLGLATFIATTIVLKMPFAWPSRRVHVEPDISKRKEGIVSAVDILISMAFATVFFLILIEGFELIGSMGLAMCLCGAFFDTFPIKPMNGRNVFKFSKILWGALFAISLALFAAWVLML